MVTTDYDMAMQLNAEMLQTFNYLQELAMRMADYKKAQNAWTWWGKKRSLKAWMEFEATLKKTIVALFLDEIIDKDASSNEVAIAIHTCIVRFSKVFPNWSDAYSFANIFFVHSSDRATSLVNELRS